MVIGFTGGRPQRLPWGNDINDKRCIELKKNLASVIENLIMEQNANTFICGMALGCDTYFAEIILHLKQKYKNIKLIAYIPCFNQNKTWQEVDINHYNNMLFQFDRINIISSMYKKGCEKKRNLLIAKTSDVLIAVFNGNRKTGTGQTLSFAEKFNKKIIIINP